MTVDLSEEDVKIVTHLISLGIDALTRKHIETARALIDKLNKKDNPKVDENGHSVSDNPVL